MKMPFLLTLVLFAFGSVIGYAQASASASFSASVTIVEPIGITTASHMNFARVEAGKGGSVVLAPDNSRTAVGGVQIAQGETGTAASFEVVGEEGFTYDLSLPEGDFVLTNGQHEIIIKNFQSDLKNKGSFAGGVQIVKVGATMEVNPDQSPGHYTNKNGFTVTVNYN